MTFPPAPAAWLVATVGACIVFSIAAYANLLRHILSRGGKVSVGEFALPDLFVGSFFAVWFGALIARGFGGEPHPLKNSDVVQGAVLFAAITFGIIGFLHYRGVKILAQFGVTRVRAFKVPGLALGLLLTAYPAIALAGKLTEFALGPKAQRQETVNYFLEAVNKSDRASLALMLAMGVIVAPVAEEFLFRGYLYGVMKRYCGTLAAMLLSSALFAAIHLNLTSLPALFVLAMCFVIAYETTGSILVNMTMHALFNLTMFLLMLNLPSSLR